MTYTEDESKQFILLRKAAQDSATNDTKKKMVAAAIAIIALSWQYKYKGKDFRFSDNKKLDKLVNETLRKMKSGIKDSVTKLAEYVNDIYSEYANDEEDKKDTDAFIDEEIDGLTYNDRAEKYSKRFKHELEAVLAAAFFFNIAKDSLTTLVTTFIGSLYNTDLFKRAAKTNGFRAARIKEEPNYGNGQYKHAFNGMVRLVDNTVGMAWMDFLGRQAKKDGKRFFYSLRGSSYPCSLCDAEQVAGIRPIQQYTGLYHARCKCYFMFLD